MSDTSQSIIIQTGADPRNWPEFSALREEINKINHPARPEVNWLLIESLALTLFRTNGVDLQTAVYYTLARTQQYGLAGFTEGCELLAGMVVGQWDQLWPEQSQARTEILEWFNARVGQQLRQKEFAQEDLRLVYRAERALQLLCDKLNQVELKRVPRIENLLYLMQNTAKRREALAHESVKQPASPTPAMPPLVYLSVPDSEAVRSSFSAPERPPKSPVQPNVDVRFMPPVKRNLSPLWGFACGVLVSLLVATALYRIIVMPEHQQLLALTAQPEGATQRWLIYPTLGTYTEQLNRLENLSPLAGLHTADASVALARQLWPAEPLQITQSQRWERIVQARSGSGVTGGNYLRLQQQLQALSDKLIEQEQNRGGLTISYLKTVVYQMQTELNRETPLEELLRQLSVTAAQHQPASPALLKHIDERWNALLSRYHQLVLLTNMAD